MILLSQWLLIGVEVIMKISNVQSTFKPSFRDEELCPTTNWEGFKELGSGEFRFADRNLVAANMDIFNAKYNKSENPGKYLGRGIDRLNTASDFYLDAFVNRLSIVSGVIKGLPIADERNLGNVEKLDKIIGEIKELDLTV